MAALGKTNTTWAKPKISTSHSPGPMGLFQPNRKKPNIKLSLQTTVKPTTTPRPPQPPQEAATTTSIRHEGTLTIPKWNPLQRAVAAALDAVETALNRHERGHPLPKSADPQVQLAGNFAPVPEQPLRRNLKVKGKVPNCISGVYVRNGANPLFPPAAGHHLFDGDGMIHAVKFSGNGVSYACRFTKTSRIVQERAVGRPVFPKPIGELHGHTGISRLLVFYTRHLFRLIDAGAGTGVSNAGVIYHHGHLLAMSEDDLPYHVRVTPAGDLATAGRYDFSGELKSPMIAHPKIDPFSGELFSLSYDVVSKPYLKYFYFSKTGEKSPDIEIPIDKPTMTHDFAISENFVIIPDSQIVFNLHEMIYGGSPVVYDKNKISRFGVLPKYAKNSNEIKWVSVPDCFCFHLWNAWEERDGDEIVIIGSCMSPADAIFNDSNEKLTSILTEIKLNLKTGESTRQPILSDPDQVNLEAGMVTRKKLGHKTRFVYLSIAEPWPKVSGFAKVDLETGEVKKYVYGDEKYGGEPFFVARDPDSDSGREDDGYVIVFVHDEREWKSELRIVNAMDMELECTVELPSRVPYGFHGSFITEEELQMQV